MAPWALHSIYPEFSIQQMIDTVSHAILIILYSRTSHHTFQPFLDEILGCPINIEPIFETFFQD